MKKLIIIADNDPRTIALGGIHMYAAKLAEYLHKEYEITYIGKKQSMPKVKKVPYKVILASNKQDQSNTAFLISLQKIAKRIKTEKDTIIHAQRPDWLYPFRKKQGKKVVSLHGPHYKTIRAKKGVLFQTIYKLIENQTLPYANIIMSVDHANARNYKKRFPQLKDKITVIPNGIDTNSFKPANKLAKRRKLGLPSKKRIYLFVGRVEIEKRVDLMIKNTSAEEMLVVIGEGNLMNSLKKISSNNILFLGAQPSNIVSEYFQAVDGFLIFSTAEGLPTTALESLASGVPIASTAVGEMPYIIKDGYNGFIVDQDNYGKYMKKLNHTMALNCRKSSLAYDWRTIIKRIKKEAYDS